MTIPESTPRQQTRQHLLDELESIHSMLREPQDELASAPAEPPVLDIPVLQDAIPSPTALPTALADSIPVLRDREEAVSLPETPASVSKTSLDDVRAAAARVAALAVRSHSNAERLSSTQTLPATTPKLPQTDSQKALVQSILAALQPELEQLLRKVLAEQLSAQADTSTKKQ